MKAIAKLDSPDEVSVTITLSAPIGEWRALRSQLGKEWPSWQFGVMLGSMIYELEKRVDSPREIFSGPATCASRKPTDGSP